MSRLTSDEVNGCFIALIRPLRSCSMKSITMKILSMLLPTTISRTLMMFGCESERSTLISRSAVTGKPCGPGGGGEAGVEVQPVVEPGGEGAGGGGGGGGGGWWRRAVEVVAEPVVVEEVVGVVSSSPP